MPIYEFRCSECGNIAELLIRTSVEKDSPKCEECGSTRMERLVSAPNIPKQFATNSPRCGKGTTCCGSPTPCESPPCS